MRVFISSVRVGLEQERDTLPGLLKAIGHEPVRFEDFTAQAVPSRQACMDAVDSCDAYLLLLGPHYGYIFPETGQSATHDEFVRARTKGLHRLVFAKEGVDREPEQQAFIDQIGDYGAGAFWASFSDVSELQVEVARALRELDQQPEPLIYEPLTGGVGGADGGIGPGSEQGGVNVTWRDDWNDPRYQRSEYRGVAELHACPVGRVRIPARVIRAMPERLITSLRESAAVPAHAGVEPRSDDSQAIVEIPEGERDLSGDLRPSQLRGVRIDGLGQISVWWALPADQLGGGILNLANLAGMAATALRVIGRVGADSSRRYALATGVSGSMLSVIDGPLPTHSRSSASFGVLSDDPVRIWPDESVSTIAFDRGADDVARDIASSLVDGFQRRR
jgi:hypothetical protein